MIRYGKLFEKIATLENFECAWKETRRKKRYTPAAVAVGERIEQVLSDLVRELREGTWSPSRYYEFETRTEVKRRIIDAPCFRDRIVHHAFYRIINPLFERKFIYDLYSGRQGKGPLAAAMRVQHFVRSAARRGKPVYVLQGDIHSYYAHIDHEILKTFLRRTIKDAAVLYYLDLMVDGYNGDTGKGIALGALPNQLFANIYLSGLDHLAKQILRVKYYARLMDDFILVSTDKEELKAWLADIRWYLETQLRLTLNPKTQIYPATRGIDFAGYRTFPDYRLPRKRNVKAAKRRFRQLTHDYARGKATIEEAGAKVQSFCGYCKHCKSRRTLESTLKWLVLRRRN